MHLDEVDGEGHQSVPGSDGGMSGKRGQVGEMGGERSVAVKAQGRQNGGKECK